MDRSIATAIMIRAMNGPTKLTMRKISPSKKTTPFSPNLIMFNLGVKYFKKSQVLR